MVKSKAGERLPELREFIKENHQRVHDFCYFMLYGGMAIDDLLLSIFRDFGDQYRRLSGKRDVSEHAEIRLRLFRVAWERVRQAISQVQYDWPVGRDTRQMKDLDEDVLQAWGSEDRDLSRLEPAILERLSRIDADFRVAVVLRDIIRFEDDDVVRVLGIRWGVYRHRLHRGRLELKDGLRARSISSEARGVALPLHPSPGLQ